MSTLFNSATLLKDNDVVGLLDSRQSMGDGDGSAVLSDPVEGSLDDLFTLGVNGTGGFVEDDDLRLLDDTSGDGKTLLLTS